MKIDPAGNPMKTLEDGLSQDDWDVVLVLTAAMMGTSVLDDNFPPPMLVLGTLLIEQHGGIERVKVAMERVGTKQGVSSPYLPSARGGDGNVPETSI